MLTFLYLTGFILTYGAVNAQLRAQFHPLGHSFTDSIVAAMMASVWFLAVPASFFMGASWQDWASHGYKFSPGPMRASNV